MKRLFPIVFAAITLCVTNVYSQNLVTNPSFETVTAEPYYGCEWYYAIGWQNPSGGSCPTNTDATPDLFSTFSTGQAVLPNSFMGTTNAHTGNRCGGIVTYHQQITNYREYFMTQLSCPLVPGQTYTVSYWTTGGNPPQYIYHTNNIGVYFSTAPLTQSGYNLINGITPQFEEASLVANTTWTQYSYTFIPNQAFSHITIGNFKDDAGTQIQSFGTNRPYAYYFFDDISVVSQNSVPLNLGPDTSYCGNFSHILSTGDPATVWSTGGTGSQITVTTPGTYWATVTSGCVTGSDTIAISLDSPPAPFALGSDTTYCGSFTQTLTVLNPNTVWSTGVTAAQITVSSGGTYSATVTNSCGSATDDIVITQNPSPVVNFGNDTTLCTGQLLLLDATNSGATYLWHDGSGAATYNITGTGVYAVTVTNNFGCSASDAIAVSYSNGPPVFTVGADTAYCGSFAHTLNAGGATAVWSTGVTAAQITVANPGLYWAAVSNGCGTKRDSVVIIQNPLPVVWLGNDTAVCTGETLLLDAVTTGATYRWSDNSTNATYNVANSGIYSVTVTDANGCTGSDSIAVNYDTQIPMVNLGPDLEVCDNKGTMLHATIRNGNYLWSTNSTDSILHIYATGNYSVTVSTGCGSATDAVNVVVHADECALLIPTAFSPNGDGANDVFRAVSRCPITRYELHVYNRWGELVFETTYPNEGWNGVFRSEPQPMEVYTYYIDYFNYCEQKMKKVTGNVTLVR